ncbi:uncharacterized protein LOC141909142 [Tubulanus polymorphus]|uniref:uncharacterized protein LOC141909142 n=1 Tax=Tubulanus polymorphus TaxID=672921 RepID=UPI003DA62770
MLSHNGSQLVAAQKEIRVWCANREISWQFITPLGPHQNGCAEALVKSVKRNLKIVIGEQVHAPFELQTIIFEVANLVNERPIGVKSSDPNDGSYICPNGILLGRASDDVPHGPFAETRNPRHRVEYCQKIVDALWKKWYRDVFPHLAPRRKWIIPRNVM